MPTLDKLEAEVEKLLPCEDHMGLGQGAICFYNTSGKHTRGCPAYYRPAVEAALAECERERKNSKATIEQQHQIERDDCKEIDDLSRKLAAAREALSDMTDLATLLDDDDPYFGERRNATERIEIARKVLAALTEAGEGESGQ